MREITKTKEQRPKSKDRFVWLLLAFSIVAVYFFALGSIPLLGPDEPRYAQVAREMFQKNDWVTPTLGGANWFEKPALLYWLQIAAYKLFGASEFAARLGSALFGLGTIFSLWILGRSVSNQKSQALSQITKIEIAESSEKPNPEQKRFESADFKLGTWDLGLGNNFANWLALIAASSIGLIAFSRGASFDIILTFPLTAALVSFFISDQHKNKSSFAFYFSLVTFYFFIGLALLAKGLIGIVFPFAIVAVYYLLSRRLPNKPFIFSLFWGTILSLLVAASWYLPMYQTHGWTFVDEFFIQHHFQRYTSNKYQHPQPFYFFFWVLPLMTLPWLPFFLAAIWNFFKVQSSKFKAQNSETLITHHSSLITFALAWLIVPLVFFSFSGSKLPGYILPALPAALILAAQYVWRFAEKSQTRKYAVQSIALATFAACAVALQFFVPFYARADTTKYLIETADAEGYQDAKILNLHTVAHNAEFYGAGRLIRDADGKLKKHFGVSEVAEEIRRQNGKTVLVLVTLEYLHELPESDLVESKVLGENGELAIVVVNGK